MQEDGRPCTEPPETADIRLQTHLTRKSAGVKPIGGKSRSNLNGG
jgi:hypothetical protein